jgi:adenosylcobinamide hydrolase
MKDFESKLGKSYFIDDHFVFKFNKPMICLSNAPYNSGVYTAKGFFFMQVDENYSGDYKLDCKKFEVENGLKDFVGFMTATLIRKTLSFAKLGDVEVFVTTGLKNKAIAGEYNEFRFGTVNMVILIDRGLTIGCLVNAVMTAVEAKAYTLLRLANATGTTSDCIGVFAFKGNTEWAGTATELGYCIGKAVRTALEESVKKWLMVMQQC